MKRDIAIYGFGGLGKEIACLIDNINQDESKWNFIGYFDDINPAGKTNLYGETLGDLSVLNNYKKPLNIVIAIANPVGVSKLIENISNNNIKFPNIISPSAIFYNKKYCEIGIGNILTPHCFVSTEVKFGNFNLVSTFVSIGHDTCIGDFNAFMPSVNISGNINIGNQNYFGVSSVVLEKKIIKDNIVLGAGGIITKDTLEPGTYIGIPAINMNLRAS